MKNDHFKEAQQKKREHSEQAANIPAVLIGRQTDKICHIDTFFLNTAHKQTCIRWKLWHQFNINLTFGDKYYIKLVPYSLLI